MDELAYALKVKGGGPDHGKLLKAVRAFETSITFHRAGAASRDLLNPLAPPGRRLEGIREILRLVHDLAVAELHNTHRVRWPSLVRDGVFRDPEITVSQNSPDVEA